MKTFTLTLHLCLLIALSACGIRGGSTLHPALTSEEVPFADFIVGHWESEKVEPEASYSFEIEFVDGQSVKLLWFADGAFLDGDTFTYEFIEANTVSAQSRRVAEPDIWTLSRDGEQLILQRMTYSGNQTITFSRTETRVLLNP